MPVVKIYKYPHVMLRETCQPVAEVTDATRAMATDLVDTMYSCPGAVGLSAPQIGYPWRIVAIDVNAKEGASNPELRQLRVMINPEIVSASRNKLVREGCLSFPEYLVNIKRATKVTVKYLTPQGNDEEAAVTHLEAIAVQHEIDHLDGVLMIDRVNSLKTDLIRRIANQ